MITDKDSRKIFNNHKIWSFSLSVRRKGPGNVGSRHKMCNVSGELLFPITNPYSMCDINITMSYRDHSIINIAHMNRTEQPVLL